MKAQVLSGAATGPGGEKGICADCGVDLGGGGVGEEGALIKILARRALLIIRFESSNHVIYFFGLYYI